MKKTKEAMVLIYILFLVLLAIIFATVLLNNNAAMFNVTQFFDVDSKLYSNIKTDSKIMIEENRKYNSNWWWFLDDMSCPESVTMSWTIVKDTIVTTLQISWDEIYCSWNYYWNNVNIYFNNDFTDITKAKYIWNTVNLNNWLWITNFWDLDTTYINFVWSMYQLWEWIDDNFNSDNYRVTSHWTTGTGVYYPNDYWDDDVFWRQKLTWYVSSTDNYKKVFWNTSKVANIINDNTNNWDDLNVKIWEANSAKLYFDIDKDSEIKLFKFDKAYFDSVNELRMLDVLEWTTTGLSKGYLQENNWVLSLSETITWKEYDFNFVNDNYWIFLKSTATWSTLLYSINWETHLWEDIYITPIDDSDQNIVRYMWNEIIIDNNWNMISKEAEILYQK